MACFHVNVARITKSTCPFKLKRFSSKDDVSSTTSKGATTEISSVSISSSSVTINNIKKFVVPLPKTASSESLHYSASVSDTTKSESNRVQGCSHPFSTTNISDTITLTESSYSTIPSTTNVVTFPLPFNIRTSSRLYNAHNSVNKKAESKGNLTKRTKTKNVEAKKFEAQILQDLMKKFVMVNISPTNTTNATSNCTTTDRRNENNSSSTKYDTLTNDVSIRNDSQNNVQPSFDPIYVIIDIETTGHEKNPSIIQLAAKVMGRKDSIYNAYIKPIDCKLPPQIEELTGISLEFLVQQGVSFVEAWCGFKKFVHEESMIKDDSNTYNHNIIQSSTTYHPVVIIAHSGKGYDFRIIRKNLKDIYSELRHNRDDNENNRPMNTLHVSSGSTTTTTITTTTTSSNEKDSISSINLCTTSIDEVMNLHWFNSIYSPTDIAYPIEYCYLDSIQIFRSPYMWSTEKVNNKQIKKSIEISTFKLKSIQSDRIKFKYMEKWKTTISSTIQNLLTTVSSMFSFTDSTRSSVCNYEDIQLSSNNVSSTISSANHTNSFVSVCTSVAIKEDTNRPIKLPQPTSKALGNLYEYILNKPLDGAHNAIADVKGLEEILEFKHIRPYWKEIGQKLLFNESYYQ